MADDVTFTLGANATPPATTKAATDEITVGPHSGAHAGIAKIAVSGDGDGTHIPATVADGLLVNLGTNNDVNAVEEPLATANQTSVADSASDVQLLAANAARKRYGITNDSTVTLYLSIDGAASLTNYLVQVPPNSFFTDDNWVGEVRGIWASDPGTGAARITEVEA